jgi:hypothetical protein
MTLEIWKGEANTFILEDIANFQVIMEEWLKSLVKGNIFVFCPDQEE